MIIIGEKLNGSIPSVKQVIAQKDEQSIREIARRQVEAGADYLDVCAGTSPEKEYDTLKWMIEIVQDEVNTPLCLDSPNPHILIKTLPLVKHEGIINSVSGEGRKFDLLFPEIQDTNWKVIILTCDDTGIPSDVARKTAIGSSLMDEAERYGIEQERIFLDPLVLALSAVQDAMITFMEAIQILGRRYPSVHFTSGLSNISYGMPKRKLVNRHFLALALEAGMDSAIIDPTDEDLISTMLVTEALLGRDRFCQAYNQAYRKGRI